MRRDRRATAARCGALSRGFVFCFRFRFSEIPEFEMSAAADCALEPGLGSPSALIGRKPRQRGPDLAPVTVRHRGAGIVIFHFPILLIHTPTKNGQKQREKNQVRKNGNLGNK